MPLTLDKTILVIDDEKPALDAARAVVTSLGFGFEGLSSAALAMELLESGVAPAAILIDLYMPGMDAVEFRNAQLADARLAAIPTVIMTSTSFSERLARAIGVPLLQKPLTAASVTEALARAQQIAAPDAALPWRGSTGSSRG